MKSISAKDYALPVNNFNKTIFFDQRQELFSDLVTKLTNPQIIEASKLTGALTAAMVSGPDDGDSVFAGSQIARNAAENNATYINKDGKILKVDVTDGDKGVYVDNQDGGTSKDVKVGESLHLDEFPNPNPESKVQKDYYIHVGSSIDSTIDSFAQKGGIAVGQKSGTISYPIDLVYLAYNSGHGGAFDIKNTLGSYNGYLLNGSYVSGRTAGNYLAGYNGIMAGISSNAIIRTAGALQIKDDIFAGNFSAINNKVPPYYGEMPYSGRAILEGIEAAKQKLNTMNR